MSGFGGLNDNLYLCSEIFLRLSGTWPALLPIHFAVTCALPAFSVEIPISTGPLIPFGMLGPVTLTLCANTGRKSITNGEPLTGFPAHLTLRW